MVDLFGFYSTLLIQHPTGGVHHLTIRMVELLGFYSILHIQHPTVGVHHYNIRMTCHRYVIYGRIIRIL